MGDAVTLGVEAITLGSATATLGGVAWVTLTLGGGAGCTPWVGRSACGVVGDELI